MKLYRVGEDVQPGFVIHRIAGQRPCISLGVDGETNAPMCLPLGSSIRDAMSHPDDRRSKFYLERAKFANTTAGLMLVAQHLDEPQDDKALIVLTHSKANGYVTEVSVAKDCSRPELLSMTKDAVSRHDLVLFRPGDGLRLFWDRRMFNPPDQAVRFTIVWDGNELVTGDLPVKHRSRAPEPMQQLQLEESPQLWELQMLQL